jgi:uncharacterized protein with PIN domain
MSALMIVCDRCEQCSDKLDNSSYFGADPLVKFEFGEHEDVSLCEVCYFDRLFDF